MNIMQGRDQLKEFIVDNPSVIDHLLSDGKVAASVSELISLKLLNPRANLMEHDFNTNGCDIELPNGFRLEQKDTFTTNSSGQLTVANLLCKKNNCDGFIIKDWVNDRCFFLFHDELFYEGEVYQRPGKVGKKKTTDNFRWFSSYDFTPRPGLREDSPVYINTKLLLRCEVITRGQMFRRIRDEWRGW